MSVSYSIHSSRTRGSTDSGALHAGKPWREVVHIAEEIGPQGGGVWVLTLDCGHTAFRKQPRLDPVRDIMAPIVSWHGKHGRPAQLTAPHRVRCLWCGPGDVPCSKLSTPSLRKLAYDVHKRGRPSMTPSQKRDLVNGIGSVSLLACFLFALLPDSWALPLVRYGVLAVFTACLLYTRITPRPPRSP